jgi:hypothetical protein
MGFVTCIHLIAHTSSTFPRYYAVAPSQILVTSACKRNTSHTLPWIYPSRSLNDEENREQEVIIRRHGIFVGLQAYILILFLE